MAKDDNRKWLVILLLLALLFFFYYKGYFNFGTGTNDKIDINKPDQKSNALSFIFYTQDEAGNWKKIETPSWAQPQSYAIVRSQNPPTCTLASDCGGYTVGGNIDCYQGKCVLARVTGMDVAALVENTEAFGFTNCKISTPTTPTGLAARFTTKNEVKNLPATSSVSFDTANVPPTTPGLNFATLGWTSGTQSFQVSVTCTNSVTSNQVTATSAIYVYEFLADPSGSGLRVSLSIPIPTTSQVCGNNLIESNEICESGADLVFGTAGIGIDNLNGKTCVNLGYTTGTLRCLSTCLAYDLTGCSGTSAKVKFRTLTTALTGGTTQSSKALFAIIPYADQATCTSRTTNLIEVSNSGSMATYSSGTCDDMSNTVKMFDIPGTVVTTMNGMAVTGVRLAYFTGGSWAGDYYICGNRAGSGVVSARLITSSIGTNNIGTLSLLNTPVTPALEMAC